MQTVLNTLFASLHNIDRNEEHTFKREVNTTDAIQYVEQLIQETLDNPNKRAYEFKNPTSPINEYILDIYTHRHEESIENIFNANCIKIAERLLLAEKNTVEKYPAMNHPKRGSLIVTVDNSKEDFIITFAKIETAEFLENINLQLQSGLPFSKKALKTAIISIHQLDEDDIEMHITISDSSSTIARYWVDDFLEVKELTSDEKNTKSAFNSIERILSQNLKTQAPSDYTELRNGLVGYFKKQQDFHFETMIDHVFGSYTMENKEVDLESVKEKINNLVEKEKFDTHFKIIPNEIKARFKKSYPISEEIELRTQGHIENLRHKIRARKNEQGENIIEIKVENDTIYKQFEFKVE